MKVRWIRENKLKMTEALNEENENSETNLNAFK